MNNWRALEENKTLLIPVMEGQEFNAVLKEKLGCEIKVDARVGNMTSVYTLNKLPMEKIIFVGVGKDDYKKGFYLAGQSIEEDVQVFVTEENAYNIALGLLTGMYSYKEKEEVNVSFSGCDQQVQDAKMMASCINEAKRWADMPQNLLTPVVFMEEAKCIAQKNGLEIEILSNEELEKKHAGGILGVNAGSKFPCYMVTIKYNGNGDAPYFALVGKGLTYDAGGYSIKKNMIGMKYDMCGAANCLATLDYLSQKKAKVNVMAILGMTQNMVDANSYIVDDVLTMMNGMTVEIANTDAEGRLVLADCLTHAQEFNISHVVDMATLTGACANALGINYTGVFTNNDEFFASLKQESLKTNEKVWQMPLDEDFHKQIHNSKVADVTNCQPGEKAGASLAAAFLEEFVQNNIPWMHLDIAGTSMFNGSANGVMIETLSKLIESI